MIESDLLQDFAEETVEQIDEVEPSLIQALEGPSGTAGIDEATIDITFRLFHTLKGNCGFLELEVLGSLAHRAEDLLDCIRHGTLPLSEDIPGLLCRTLDLVRQACEQLLESGTDADLAEPATQLEQELTAMSGNSEAPPNAAPSQPAAPEPARQEPSPSPPEDEMPAPEVTIDPDLRDSFVEEADEQLQAASLALIEAEEKPETSEAALNEAFRAVHSFKGNCGFLSLVDLAETSAQLESLLEMRRDGILSGPVQPLLDTLDALAAGVADLSRGGTGEMANRAAVQARLEAYADGRDVDPAPDTPEDDAGTATEGESAPASPPESAGDEPAASAMQQVVRQDIRVNLHKLDELINLVGELVLAEAMVTRNPVLRDLESEELDSAVHQLRRVTGELQDVAMSVRMVPLSGTFRKMIRLVHDVAQRRNRQVKLELAGEDTEVDKTVIELIADPLVHLVRNAIDHGIEPTEERRQAGKPVPAQLRIDARHDSGEVQIRVSDDGRGLQRDAILARARERGLVQDDGGELSDEEVYQLVFSPGFSTATEVSDVSGRGVGMDVVRANIERLKGRIDLRSQPGKGTTVLLRIPLTLAIIDGMLVQVGDSLYTIPLLAIRESLRPGQSQVLQTPDGNELLRLREEIIPVLRLHRLFAGEPLHTELDQGIVVVVEDAGQSVGLFIDEIYGQQQTVIKGLSDYLGEARAVSGCTILGDGRVSLILDVPGLVEMSADLAPEAAPSPTTIHAPSNQRQNETGRQARSSSP